jgi:hypothetical protein
MKINSISPYGIMIVGFVMLNVLTGMLYRFNDMFNTTMSLYLWLGAMIGATILLFWGLILHMMNYNKPIKNIGNLNTK